jgi:HEAT repeat protein
LFENHDKEVKEDILQLLTDYSKDSLDYLAERIELIETELLADAIYALGLTFNIKYVPTLIRYENHEHTTVRNVAKEALLELSKSNRDSKK